MQWTRARRLSRHSAYEAHQEQSSSRHRSAFWERECSVKRKMKVCRIEGKMQQSKMELALYQSLEPRIHMNNTCISWIMTNSYGHSYWHSMTNSNSLNNSQYFLICLRPVHFPAPVLTSRFQSFLEFQMMLPNRELIILTNDRLLLAVRK